MPVVPAASIPYTPYPTVEPEVRSPRAFQDVRAPQQAFGASVGEAVQGVGRTIERGGDVLAEAALRQQELANQVGADNASNWWQEQANKLQYGDPATPGDTGFFGKKGQDAADSYLDVRNKIDSSLQTARGQLANPRQQLMFDQETRRLRAYFMNSVGQHYGQQLNALHVETTKAGVDLAMHGAATASANNNDAEFTQRIGEAMTKAVSGLKMQGASPEMIDAKLADIRGSAVKMRAQDLADTNPLAAKEFLDKNTDALAPGEKAALDDHIRGRATKQQALRDAWGATGQAVVPPEVGGAATPAPVPATLEEKGRAAAAKYNVPWEIFSHQIAGESGWNPQVADSSAGAQGIAQFIPGTAQKYGVNVKDVDSSLDGAAHYLADLRKQSGSWTAALTGYLSGDARPFELTSVTGQNPSYAKAYAAAKAIDTGTNADTLYKEPAIPGSVLPAPEPGMLPDSSVPGLGQKLEQVYNSIPKDASPERFQAAANEVRRTYNMMYQDRQRQLRDHEVQTKMASQKREDQFLQRMFPGSPNAPTTQEILQSDMLPETKTKLVGFSNREGAADPAQSVDKSNAVDLFSRMNLPDNDSKKITTEKPFDDAYVNGQITRPTHDWIVKQFRDARSAGGETLAQRKKELVEAVKTKVLGPNLGEGTDFLDPERKMRMYGFIENMNQQIEAFQKAGKNPNSLFDPKSGDFLGAPESLKAYAPPLSTALKASAAPGQAPVEYKSPEDVAAALRAGRLNYEQATQMLTTKWPDRFHIAPAAPAVEVPVAR